jgi:hypothetical protein
MLYYRFDAGIGPAHVNEMEFTMKKVYYVTVILVESEKLYYARFNSRASNNPNSMFCREVVHNLYSHACEWLLSATKYGRFKDGAPGRDGRVYNPEVPFAWLWAKRRFSDLKHTAIACHSADDAAKFAKEFRDMYAEMGYTNLYDRWASLPKEERVTDFHTHDVV